MIAFLLWYLLVSLLGWLIFPLAWRLFPSLADRGFTLARTLGLLLWGYLFWFFASLGIIQNNAAGLLFTFLLVVGSGAWLARKVIQPGRSPISAWLRANKILVIVVEGLFLLAFAAWTLVRASNPSIETAGGEKTMELAFINAILRSPTFPPHDPWLSGFSISYYYFGYVMTAMLAKATATPGAVAHNLMLALIFALSFIGSYGLIYNLLAVWRKGARRANGHLPGLVLPLLGPVFLLLISNAAGFLEVLHRRGIGWRGNPGDRNIWTALGNLVRPNLHAYNFWTWLDILHLNQQPVKPYQWKPDRFIWWWQDSRVVQDYDLAGVFTEIIDEFPAFSYLLGDLHPHVLVMPFVLLMLAFALNLFLGGWRGRLDLRFYRLPVTPLHFFMGALLLGGLAFLNFWDVLLGLALVTGAFILYRQRQDGWHWRRLVDLLAFSLPMVLLALVLYLPFFLSFSSQAGGILPNLEYPTRGAHLWVMFMTLLLPLFAFLYHLAWGARRRMNWRLALGIAVGTVLLLWGFSWGLAFVLKVVMPSLATQYLADQGFTSLSLFFMATLARRFAFIGGLLTLLAILVPCIALLAGWQATPRLPNPAQEAPVEAAVESRRQMEEMELLQHRPLAFVLFMILVGAVLVLAPDFVYLRDLFGKRMNTIFKFYYQAWILWSLASAFGVAVLLRSLRRARLALMVTGLIVLLVAGLAFLSFALPNKTDDFRLPVFRAVYQQASNIGDPAPLRTAIDAAWTLDGARAFHNQFPDDAAAADWLATALPGVVAEAVGGSYSNYGRISVYSGQPAVVGWIFHEDQWRGTFTEQRQRGEQDIPRLYQTSRWEEAVAILEKYNIRYVVVGSLERSTYRVQEGLFQRNLVPVFRSGDVVIYEVP